MNTHNTALLREIENKMRIRLSNTYLKRDEEVLHSAWLI